MSIKPVNLEKPADVEREIYRLCESECRRTRDVFWFCRVRSGSGGMHPECMKVWQDCNSRCIKAYVDAVQTTPKS